MNIGSAKAAFSVAKKAYGSYADYRDRQAVKAYEALLEAANNYDIKGRFDDSTQRFNTLSEKALQRFDDLRSEINIDKTATAATSHLADLGEAAQTKTAQLKKRQAKKVKAATKKAKKAARKKSGGKRVVRFGLFTAVTIALGGAVYYFLGQGNKKKHDSEPPKVEEYEASRLVYSTSTEDDQAEDTKNDSTDSTDNTVAEQPAERDEELLNSLEEQLAAQEEVQEKEQEG